MLLLLQEEEEEEKKVWGLIPGSELLSRGSGSKGKLSMKVTSALVEIVKNRLKE